VPVHAEDYVHRIGRTGRAGRSGTAITLVASSDQKHIDAVTKLIQRDIPWLEQKGRPAPAAEESADEAPAPRKRGVRRGSDRQVKPATKATQPPADEKPASKPRKPRPDSESGIDVHSPFGSDGPVPAFLLRSTGR
jgi:superfamily II DNA/RNA helicase